MSIYDKKTFDNALEDIFNQNIFGERKNTSKKSESDYITFVIQEEKEDNFPFEMQKALKIINRVKESLDSMNSNVQRDLENSLKQLKVVLNYRKKSDCPELTDFVMMFNNFNKKNLKEIVRLTLNIQSLLKNKKIITNKLTGILLEESESFGKNIRTVIRNFFDNSPEEVIAYLKSALIQIEKGDTTDFKVQDFNSLVLCIKIIDIYNRLKFVEYQDFLSTEIKTLIDTMNSYKKGVPTETKIKLEIFKDSLNDVMKNQSVERSLYQNLNSLLHKIINGQTNEKTNTTILNNSVDSFKKNVGKRLKVKF